MTKVIIHEAHVQGDERSGYRPTCRCGWAGATWAVRTRPRMPESMRRHHDAMTALGRGHNEKEQR